MPDFPDGAREGVATLKGPRFSHATGPDTSGPAPAPWEDAAGRRPLTYRLSGGPCFELYPIHLDVPAHPLHPPSDRMPARYSEFLLRLRCGRGEDVRPGEFGRLRRADRRPSQADGTGAERARGAVRPRPA